MVILVKRGSSSDVSPFHSSNYESRQLCSVEFWWDLPCYDNSEQNLLSIEMPSLSSSSNVQDNNAKSTNTDCNTESLSVLSHLSSVLLLATVHYNQMHVYSSPTSNKKKDTYVPPAALLPITTSKIVYYKTKTNDDNDVDGNNINKIMIDDMLSKYASATCFELEIICS